MPDRPFPALNDWDIAVPHPHPDDSSTPHPNESSTPHPDDSSTPRPSTVPNAFSAIEVLRVFTAADVLRCSTAADFLPASTTIASRGASSISDSCDAPPIIEPCDAKSSSGADTDHRFHLDRPAPAYHHDLEALIWIFVWVVCCYDGGLAVDCHDGGLVNRHDAALADCHNRGLVDCHDAALVGCHNGGLADCHDGQPRLNPLPQPFAEWMLRGDSRELLANADSHELLATADSHELLATADSHEFVASVRRCLESKESLLSTITMWDGCEPAAVWGAPRPMWGTPIPTRGAPTPMWGASMPMWGAPTPTWGAPTPTWGAPIPVWEAPIPMRNLVFAMPAKPSTIWTAASAMWEIAGPTRTTPTDQLDVVVTPSALALRMLSFATGYIGERSLAFARPRCMEDRQPRPERDDCSEKNAEGDLRSHYVKNASGMARKDDALGKTSADDPGKVWIDFEEMISKCVTVQDDNFRGVLNDWDLAVDPSDLHAPTARTTHLMPFGTPPFMAVDMLEEDALKGKVDRLYRHDLESLFYVLTWAACCYKDGRRLDPLPRMFEKWALGSLSIRPRDFMARLLAYEDPYPLQTCCNSKFSFIAGGRQWPEDIPWRELGYTAEGLRFFFMGEEAARWAVWDRPAGRAIQMAEFMALIEGREPPPRPQEADEPEKMWEGFCAAVREVIEDIIIMVSDSNARL